jgi:hypothetical protein
MSKWILVRASTQTWINGAMYLIAPILYQDTIRRINFTSTSSISLVSLFGNCKMQTVFSGHSGALVLRFEGIGFTEQGNLYRIFIAYGATGYIMLC